MPSLTLCSAALSGPGASRTAACWDGLGLEQLVFGEASLPESELRRIVPDVFMTLDDQPCLHDVLRQAGRLATNPWLLLADSGLRPTRAMLSVLQELMQLQGGPRLAHGRAWRAAPDREVSLPDQTVEALIRDPETHLDPPHQPSWVLLPRQCLLNSPAEISCQMPAATSSLAEQARLAGWTVLEATAACPCQREGLVAPSSERPHAAAVVLPKRPGQPKLSLLVAAPEERFAPWRELLLPIPGLPWELVLRPDPDPQKPGSTLAAWNSALEVAQGEIIWPLTGTPVLPYLLPVLLDFFDQPWLDLALLGSSLAGQALPASAARQGLAGSLAIRREWLVRMGGFRLEAGSTQEPSVERVLRQLIIRAEQRGALTAELPLMAIHRPG